MTGPAQREAFRRCLEGTALYDIEFRVRMKTGEYRWFRSRGACEHDAQGQPIRVSGAFRTSPSAANISRR